MHTLNEYETALRELENQATKGDGVAEARLVIIDYILSKKVSLAELAIAARKQRTTPSRLVGVTNATAALDLDQTCALSFRGAALFGKEAGVARIKGKVKAGNAFSK